MNKLLKVPWFQDETERQSLCACTEYEFEATRVPFPLLYLKHIDVSAQKADCFIFLWISKRMGFT